MTAMWAHCLADGRRCCRAADGRSEGHQKEEEEEDVSLVCELNITHPYLMGRVDEGL